MYWNFRIDIAIDLGRVHVGDMLEASWESMVLADEGIEDISKVNVGVLITSIDTTVLVVELNSAGNGLGKGEARGLGDNLMKFVPLSFGYMLGNQAML